MRRSPDACAVEPLTVSRKRQRNTKLKEFPALHRVVSREQWIAERTAARCRRKEFTRQPRRARARSGAALPWVQGRQAIRVRLARRAASHSRTCSGAAASCSCSTSCRGPDQPLAVRGLRAGQSTISKACCRTSRTTTCRCVAIARATMPELDSLRDAHGLAHSCSIRRIGSDFNYDYGVSFKTGGHGGRSRLLQFRIRQPRASKTSRATASFYQDASGDIFHTYSNYSRGGEDFLGIYRILEVTPQGRAMNHGPSQLDDRLGPARTTCTARAAKWRPTAVTRRPSPAACEAHMEAASRREFSPPAPPSQRCATVAGAHADPKAETAVRAGLLSRQGRRDLRRSRRHRQQRLARIRARKAHSCCSAGRTARRRSQALATGIWARRAVSRRPRPRVDAMDREVGRKASGRCACAAPVVSTSRSTLIGLGGDAGSNRSPAMPTRRHVVVPDREAPMRTHFITATAAARHMENTRLPA